MSEVSIRELRNHGGDVVERVLRGESLTVTRNGAPVAELRPLRAEPVPLELLRAHWRRLPAVDPDALRADLDALVDPAL